jgi:acetyl-CoA synthetase
MLACARIGAIHSVVFGGFSAESLRDRINDAKCRLLDHRRRRLPARQIVAARSSRRRSARGTPSIEHVVVVQRAAASRFPCTCKEGRDHWYPRLMRTRPPVRRRADGRGGHALHPLHVRHDGKPKGIVHTTGGYLVGTYATTKMVFDLREDDVYWCTADHRLGDGPQLRRLRSARERRDRRDVRRRAGLAAEGSLLGAHREVRRDGVLHGADGDSRVHALGHEWPQKRDLTSLRLLGSVGEPINPKRGSGTTEVIGGERCPVVDTWWQTETGAIMITPLPGVTTLKPGSATRPFPGSRAENPQRARRTKWSRRRPAGADAAVAVDAARHLRRSRALRASVLEQVGAGVYVTGDGAKRDADGYFWLLGRVDDVINVAGHRIGTMEVESALVDHPSVAEAAVVGRAHEIKGQAIAAFVTLKEGARELAGS